MRVAEITDRNLRPDAEEAVRLYGMRAMAEKIENLPYHAMRAPRITAQLIAYWGVLSESIESIYDLVDEIIVAFGPCPEAPRVDDGSLDRIRAYPDPRGKITVEARDEWRDKKEMRTWCSDRAVGNYMLVLDGDEIWVGLDNLIESGVLFGNPRWLNLWHGGEFWVRDHPSATTTATGGQRWGFAVGDGRPGSYCPHYRWSWWRRTYFWKHHSIPACATKEELFTKNSLTPPKAARSESEMCARKVPGCTIYHLGHALPEAIMRAKHDFYCKRDGDDPGRRQRMRSWHEWNGEAGDCGDGVVERVDWGLPDIVRRAVESAKGLRVR